MVLTVPFHSVHDHSSMFLRFSSKTFTQAHKGTIISMCKHEAWLYLGTPMYWTRYTIIPTVPLQAGTPQTSQPFTWPFRADGWECGKWLGGFVERSQQQHIKSSRKCANDHFIPPESTHSPLKIFPTPSNKQFSRWQQLKCPTKDQTLMPLHCLHRHPNHSISTNISLRVPTSQTASARA